MKKLNYKSPTISYKQVYTTSLLVGSFKEEHKQSNVAPTHIIQGAEIDQTNLEDWKWE